MTTIFIEYIKPIHQMCTIFGLSFNSYETDKSVWTYLKLFISLPFISAYTFCCYMSIDYLLNNVATSSQYLEANEIRIFGIVCMLDFFITLAFNIYRKKDIQNTVNGIYAQMKSAQNFEKKRTNLIIELAIISAAYFILVIIDWNFRILTNLYFYLVIVTNIYTNALISKAYSKVLAEIHVEFDHINAQLESVNDLSINLILSSKPNRKSLPRTNKHGLKSIISLLEDHRKLSESSQETCNVFCFKILMQICFYFCMLVFSANPSVRTIARIQASGGQHNYFDVYWLLGTFLWNFKFFYYLYNICHNWRSIQIKVSPVLFCVITFCPNQLFPLLTTTVDIGFLI